MQPHVPSHVKHLIAGIRKFIDCRYLCSKTSLDGQVEPVKCGITPADIPYHWHHTKHRMMTSRPDLIHMPHNRNHYVIIIMKSIDFTMHCAFYDLTAI